jgi:hypothetical protein
MHNNGHHYGKYPFLTNFPTQTDELTPPRSTPTPTPPQRHEYSTHDNADIPRSKSPSGFYNPQNPSQRNFFHTSQQNSPNLGQNQGSFFPPHNTTQYIPRFHPVNTQNQQSHLPDRFRSPLLNKSGDKNLNQNANQIPNQASNNGSYTHKHIPLQPPNRNLQFETDRVDSRNNNSFLSQTQFYDQNNQNELNNQSSPTKRSPQVNKSRYVLQTDDTHEYNSQNNSSNSQNNNFRNNNHSSPNLHLYTYKSPKKSPHVQYGPTSYQTRTPSPSSPSSSSPSPNSYTQNFQQNNSRSHNASNLSNQNTPRSPFTPSGTVPQSQYYTRQRSQYNRQRDENDSRNAPPHISVSTSPTSQPTQLRIQNDDYQSTVNNLSMSNQSRMNYSTNSQTDPPQTLKTTTIPLQTGPEHFQTRQTNPHSGSSDRGLDQIKQHVGNDKKQFTISHPGPNSLTIVSTEGIRPGYVLVEAGSYQTLLALCSESNRNTSQNHQNNNQNDFPSTHNRPPNHHPTPHPPHVRPPIPPTPVTNQNPPQTHSTSPPSRPPHPHHPSPTPTHPSSQQLTTHNPFPNGNYQNTLHPFDNITLNTYFPRSLQPNNAVHRKYYVFIQPSIDLNVFRNVLISIILTQIPNEYYSLPESLQQHLFPSKKRYVLGTDGDGGERGSGGKKRGQNEQRLPFAICPCYLKRPVIEFKELKNINSQNYPKTLSIPIPPLGLGDNLFGQNCSVFFIDCFIPLSNFYDELKITNECISPHSQTRRILTFSHQLVHDPISFARALINGIGHIVRSGNNNPNNPNDQNNPQNHFDIQVHIDQSIPK